MAGGNILYDLVGAEPELLTEYARSFNNEVLMNQFALATWLPAQELTDLEFRVRTGSFRDVDVAEYRAFDTQPRLVGRQGFGQIRGEIPPLARGIPLGEEHMLRLNAMLQNDPENGDLIRAIYDDVDRMVRSVQGRIELARGQLLTTGKVTINENGIALEADFGLASDHMPAAAVSHFDPAADMIGDWLAWQQKVVDDSGAPPATALISTRYLNAMLVNEGMMAMAGVSPSMVRRLTVEAVNGVLGTYALPVPVTYDTKVRVDGTQTRVIADDKVIFLPPAEEKLGVTFYGVTAEALKLGAKGLIKKTELPGIVAYVIENDSPVQMVTYASAIAMPALPAPELLLVADVDP